MLWRKYSMEIREKQAHQETNVASEFLVAERLLHRSASVATPNNSALTIFPVPDTASVQRDIGNSGIPFAFSNLSRMSAVGSCAEQFKTVGLKNLLSFGIVLIW